MRKRACIEGKSERILNIKLYFKGEEEMAKEKKLVQSITSRDEDFAQWYTDVVREAKLCDYSGVKGCLNYLPDRKSTRLNSSHTS